MSYKDEYEVARLYTESDFLARVADQFEGPYELRFHLAPPLLAERDPATGHLQKRVYGPWMLTAFRLLARLRFLRGTRFDLFGRTAERRAERRLVTEYEALIREITDRLAPENHAVAIELAALPLKRGFGHIKEANLSAPGQRGRPPRGSVPPRAAGARRRINRTCRLAPAAGFAFPAAGGRPRQSPNTSGGGSAADPRANQPAILPLSSGRCGLHASA